MTSVVGLILYLLYALLALGLVLLLVLWLGYGFASLSTLIRGGSKELDRCTRREGPSR